MQFFIAPTLQEDALGKVRLPSSYHATVCQQALISGSCLAHIQEAMNVDSENQKNLQQDEWRIQQVPLQLLCVLPWTIRIIMSYHCFMSCCFACSAPLRRPIDLPIVACASGARVRAQPNDCSACAPVHVMLRSTR